MFVMKDLAPATRATIPGLSRYYQCKHTVSSVCYVASIVSMSSVLSLAQPSHDQRLHHARVSSDYNDELVEIQCHCWSTDEWRWLDSVRLSRWAWGTSDEIYNVNRAVVLVPWHSSPPETPPDIFLFCFLSRFRIVWCVRVSIKQ